jgi:hypothetical protein
MEPTEPVELEVETEPVGLAELVELEEVVDVVLVGCANAT